MKYKFLFLIFLLFIPIIFLTGCSDAIGVEELAYVVALGFDEGESNSLKLTFQFAVLNSSNSDGSNSQSNDFEITSIECSTLDDGISLVNSYISKKIDLSHCKVIVFSETLATKGLSECVYTLVNNVQIRPTCNVIISRCDACDFLSNSQPTLESASARYYEFIINSREYSGYTDDIYLSNFYANILSSSSQAVGILGGINVDSSHRSTPESDILAGKYKADETPIETSTDIENIGLAVFRKDVLVGELNNIESLCHLIITNNLDRATISLANPYNYEHQISLYISHAKNTKHHVKLVNGFPYIECEVYVNAILATLDDTLDLSDQNTLSVLEESSSYYLEREITSYLYKTSKVFKSDICNFGTYLLPKYLTWNDWIESDWLNNYKNSFFKVSVNVNLESSYLYTNM